MLIQIDVIQRFDDGPKGLLECYKVRDIFYLVLEPFSLYDNLNAEIMPMQGLGRAIVVAEGVGAGERVFDDHLISAHNH